MKPRFAPACALALWVGGLLTACGDAELSLPVDSHCLTAGGSFAATPSTDCATCHQEIYHSWQGSHHASAEQVLEPGAVMVEALGPDGRLQSFAAVRSIGVDPLVQYLVDLDGNLQVTQKAKDVHGEWFDVFADGRQPGEWGHWTGRGMNWDTMCAVCHNTGVERTWSMEEDRFTTKVLEHGVGCVACHGAGEQRTPTAESCFPCHARRAELAPHQGPASFLDFYDPALPDLTETFHVDGQIQEEDFEWTSFALSKMAAAGVTCLDCHDPHTSQLRQQGDALCMSCHSGGGRLPAPTIQPLAHSSHSADVGLSCTDCHMPTTVYMQRDPRHDHGFHTPDPRLTLELGVPNACNRCHQDQTPSWAAQHVEARSSWTGNIDARRRARAVHAARNFMEDAVPQLLQAHEAETHDVWRATFLGLMQEWRYAPEVDAILQAAASSDDALIRSKALPHADMLQDPVRLVRLHAARAAGAEIDLQSQAGQDLLQWFLHNRGHAATAMEEAQFLSNLGNPQTIEEVALPLLALVKKWDRSIPAPLQLFATALDRLDRRAEALQVMEDCCTSFPNDARSWYLLGLAAGGQQDYVRCREALERALELQPIYPEARRNLQALDAFEQQQ
ncbi:MAG: ammonia-forming cytochrome c nitrite reductase subunit c552 [Planctomycetota bacterium]